MATWQLVNSAGVPVFTGTYGELVALMATLGYSRLNGGNGTSSYIKDCQVLSWQILARQAA